ncbi:LAMI_0B08482g1_1 [Lachancea mirantina]|uniref:LAMI_0B08482g1_1 n=1 Tax=Lachancea mirantina TaxID=1230905 RepID=A0A1G4IXU7_9SACH|nr:LAMI_0B08482g1_1 [Lachancea mirantina]
MGGEPWWKQWNPDNITLSDTTTTDAWKTCVIQGVYWSDKDQPRWLGARISSIFVILFVSTAFTMFPVFSSRRSWLRIPQWVYLFARYFGTGVIVATAFIHLLDPAYSEIGGSSCVGMSGNWAIYSWCPAIVLATIFGIFFVDLGSALYVERRFGIQHQHGDGIEDAIVRKNEPSVSEDVERSDLEHERSHNSKDDKLTDIASSVSSEAVTVSFESQFGAFLVLEFGVIFHSVMIGLNLGSCGDEFSTLYPVLVFHQSFEGLGIGARLSAIRFPEGKIWWAYGLCLIYGLTTPVCVAIGLGVRNSYEGNSYAVNVVSGILDAISAGILIYTGLVELLARDFMFDENRTKDVKKIIYMIICTLWGAGLMALLGKWA